MGRADHISKLYTALAEPCLREPSVAEPLQRLLDLHAIRDPLYKEVADFVVAGSGLSATQVAQRVAMQVELGQHS